VASSDYVFCALSSEIMTLKKGACRRGHKGIHISSIAKTGLNNWWRICF